MADGGAGGGLDQAIDLREVRIADLARSERFYTLDRLEAYYRCRQDAHKEYDWDGYFVGYGASADIAPGWFVPYKRRRPSARYDLAKVIVNRLTSMLFGSDRFPEVRAEGDPETEDFLKSCVEVSRLPARMAEARSLGGACGSVCASWGLIDGRPRVEVHNSKHCTIVRWVDQSEFRVGAAVKCYAFPRRVMERGKPTIKDFYFVRYWDENTEITWEPMPLQIAQSESWSQWPIRQRVEHRMGRTPFYWCQNIPDSVEIDGECDYDGLCSSMDEINQLLSAATKGTKSNVDPTLILRMDPALNTGTIKRGTDNVIYSPGGAEYLELQGQSTTTAMDLIDKLRAMVLDAASVVLADPEKLSGAAQSAQALRILYAPMLAKCDLLREQYGEYLIKPILRDMLAYARALEARAPERVAREDGLEVEQVQRFALPARVERVEIEVETAEGDDEEEAEEVEIQRTPRTPGDGETIELNWNPYFSPTWGDIKSATEAVKLANGDKPVISQRTAIAAVQSLFGVADVDAELAALEEAADRDVVRASRTFGAGPEPVLESERFGEAEDGEAEDGKLSARDPRTSSHSTADVQLQFDSTAIPPAQE